MSELIIQTADVAIIGGGVIGLAVARALALRGVREVRSSNAAVLEPKSSRRRSGNAGATSGSRLRRRIFSLCRQSRDMYPAFADSLLEETGIDIELDTTGTLYLGFN